MCFVRLCVGNASEKRDVVGKPGREVPQADVSATIPRNVLSGSV